MPTKKLYYTDPYTMEFSGENFTVTELQNKPAIIFPETYFYPTSGGQERDFGTINDCQVTDIVESDGEIFHVLDKPFSGAEYHAKIDWNRRFLNMQQHTGQHLLSRAIEDLFNLDTISSRLGESGNTIDLNLTQFTEDMLSQTEKYVNEIIWKCKPIKVHFADVNQIDQFPLRSKPKVSGVVRIIEIENYDFNACGGTHCSNTGEVGIIKITGTEKVKGNLVRLNFVCGGKALLDFQNRVSTTNHLSAKISATGIEMIDQVDRLITENKNYQKKLSALNQQILIQETDQLAATAKRENGLNIVSKIYTHFSADDIRFIASRLSEKPNMVSLLATRTDRLSFCFSSSPDVNYDFKKVLPELLQMTNGKGGGKPEFIQFTCDVSIKPEEIISVVQSKING